MKARQNLTEGQFIKQLSLKGYDYSRHQAMTGSQYWTIQGIKYRISDHYNPNKCFEDGRIEANSYSHILNTIEVESAKKRVEHQNREWLFDQKADDFYKNPDYSPVV